ncbi:MAG TPA: c-type cytochrome [Gammaproteobacteria bacterium]|nr:c-type cytochrome [Gammaproteobacteria bacterium]
MNTRNSFRLPSILESRSIAAASRLPRSFWKWAIPAAALIAVIAAVAVHFHLQNDRLAYGLLAAMPDEVVENAALVRFAVAEAKPLYTQHCAVCHGANLRGNPKIGAPNLTDAVWLYGTGRVFDIERTLMYGVRSGRSKTHNITDMPGYGLRGKLSAAEVRDVVQYLLKINGRPYQVAAANEGKAIYYDYNRGNCGDCHGADAKGDPAYGSADLTVNTWNSGSDPESLYRAVYYGEHRMMPAWIDTLSLEQIRALAVYVYTVSHKAAPPPAPSDGGPAQ